MFKTWAIFCLQLWLKQFNSLIISLSFNKSVVDKENICNFE